jgi:thiamine-monophosphate kinase
MTLGENDLVRKLLAALPLPPHRASLRSISLGPGDDAALFPTLQGYQSILTCDWFLEGTHFLREKHPPDSIGWKCLARAASDVAAMGGRPRCFLLSLALPASCTGRWLDQFLLGLRRASTRLSCPLAGGDTTQRDEILLNVTVLGEVRSGRALTRSGARPGDKIFVSGRLGEAERGLQALRKMRRVQPADPLLQKHLYPEPRVALGQWLAQHRIATAMMDLSDGLSTDLPRLCAASAVGARIELARLPASQPSPPKKTLRAMPTRDSTDFALNGGDDYELLFTVSPAKARNLPSRFKGLLITQIGEITRERKLLLVQPDGSHLPLKDRGWNSFASK